MAVEDAADLASFFDASEFGISATIGGSPVDGIFDHEYVEVLNVASESPVFNCLTADVSAVSVGDAVVINLVNYIVVEIHPDGTGITQLILQET